LQDSIFKLSDVSLMLDERYVVRDLTWEIKRRENWALIGPNGAGKTSVLSIINGYRWPTSGKVTVLGREFGRTDLRELRTKIGMVSAYLGDWITGKERAIDLVVSGKYGSVKLWKERGDAEVEYAESLMRLTNCFQFRDKRVGELSQGERQRVLISRALMGRPKLLTLDEPCEGLDLGARESFLQSITSLIAKGVASIVDVTHRTDEIPRGFTHALLLDDGRKVAAGPINEVVTAENLSRCFGVEVAVKKWGGRYYTVVS
jgi:iron complex transport system ATP-binding protein